MMKSINGENVFTDQEIKEKIDVVNVEIFV
jgi:uncharacterized protein YfkK (UPF0435 family)